MPIEISVAETTRSMIMNGRNSANPMMNARRSSLMTKAGTSTSVGTSGRSHPPSFLGCFVASMKSATSRTRTCLNMNSRRWPTARSNATACEICLALSAVV